MRFGRSPQIRKIPAVYGVTAVVRRMLTGRERLVGVVDGLATTGDRPQMITH